jgi:hypothetical protein
MTISTFSQVCDRHDSIASESQGAAFLQGMMTETRADMSKGRRSFHFVFASAPMYEGIQQLENR